MQKAGITSNRLVVIEDLTEEELDKHLLTAARNDHAAKHVNGFGRIVWKCEGSILKEAANMRPETETKNRPSP